MALILTKWRRGLDANLASTAIEDGQILVTTDTARLLVNIDGSRIEITDFVKDTEANILATTSPITGKFYYATDTYKIYYYNGTSFVTSAAELADAIKATLATTTKAYVLGVTASGTTPIYDSGVYLDTTAGKLTATTFNGYTLAAACAKAVTDSSSASAIGTGTSVPTERDIYYGLPTINGSHSYTSSTNIYAPTSAGTSGYVLTSSGSGAPTWSAASSLSASKAESLSSARTITLTGVADGSFDFDGSEDVDVELKDNIIIGSQTASTSAWTGVLPGVEALYDGLSISYWLPYAATSTNVTLNLTLDDGTTTGAVNVYRSGTTRLTTRYTAGNVIRMTYRSGAVISGGTTTYTGWWCDADYDTDTTTKSASGDTSSLIYLIGATTQSTSGQTTYSHDTVYVDTDGTLYSNGIQVVTLSDTQALTNKTYNGYTLAAACAKSLSDSSSASALSSTDTNVPTVRDIYYGLPTINGSHSYTSSTNIYAPTSAGTSGYILTSAGSGAPTWTATSSISIGSATSADSATLASTVTTASSTSAMYAVGVASTATTTLLYTTGVTMTNGAVVATTYNGYTLAAACAKAVTDSSSASAISTGTSLTTERDVYYGLPTINNSHAYTSSTTIYAPTAGGTSGYVLIGAGTTTAPTWTAQSNIAAGSATKDGSGNTISSYYAPLASPALTGTPTATTATAGTSTTQIATTAFVTTAVNNAIASTTSIAIEVVTTLPTTGTTGVIYLVADTHSDDNDSYDEYLWVEANSAYEKIGNTDVDLSNYVTLTGSQALTNKTYNGYTLASACAKSYTDRSTATAISSSGTTLLTERAIYYGLPTINGSHSYTSSTSIYAPTSAGTSGYILTSAGSGAPTWTATSSISIGSATSADSATLASTVTTTSSTSAMYAVGVASTATTTLLYNTGVTMTSGAIVATTYNGYTLAAACAKAVTDSSSASAISTGTSLTTERDVYYGLPTINGSHSYTSSTNIYAPTSAGTSGYILTSAGSGAPTWTATSSISIGSATSADSATTAETADLATTITATAATTTKAYVLGVTATGTTPIYDTGVYLDTTAGRLTATSVNAGLVTTTTNPTSATTYYSLWLTGSGGKPYINDGYRYISLQGTADADGYGIVQLGNSTASGTAANKYGGVRIYGTDAYYWQISGNKAATANTTLYLPTSGGCLVVATNATAVGGTAKPVYISSSGVATACSSTVGSGVIPTYMSSGTITASTSTVGAAAKPIYMNAGTLTACSSTVGSTTQPVYMSSGTITAMSGALAVAYGGTGATTAVAGNAVHGFGYGTCSTANGTAAKTVSISSFALVTGGLVSVTFTYAVDASATLNVNSTGAKSIYHMGAAIKANMIQAGATALFVYTGTYFYLLATDTEAGSDYIEST